MIAIYARVSVRHRNKKDLSIANQVTICKKYLGKEQEYLVYEDCGYSGKDFKRPGFQRMLEDVYAGRVQCILVKDLSRLGREYIQVGGYLEKTFPRYQVRVIAVNDGYDSDKSLQSTNPFVIKNLLNEWYRRDISQKVSMVKKQQKDAGNYMGSHARYGYDIVIQKGKRVLRPNACIGVRFAVCVLLKNGYSSAQVALWLAQKRVNPPREYEHTRQVYSRGNADCKKWNAASVRKMGQQGV